MNELDRQVRDEFEEWVRTQNGDLLRTGSYYASRTTQANWDAWQAAMREYRRVGQGDVVFQRRVLGGNSISPAFTVKMRSWELISKNEYESYRRLMGGNGPKGVIGHPMDDSRFELNSFSPMVEVRALQAEPEVTDA